MKKLIISSMAVLLAVSMLTGCTSSQRKDTGMIAGAVVGGVAGSALSGGNTAATVAGAAGGAYVGRALTN